MLTPLRRSAQKVVPWINGQGVTREVLVVPGPTPGRFAWRISIATIDRPGPFSTYPGVDRTIMVIDGAGMILRVDGVPHRVERPYEPIEFAGEAAVVCTPLGGTIHDFNVMTDRSVCADRTAVLRLVIGESRPRSMPGQGLLACLAGRLSLAAGDAPAIVLEPWDAVLVEKEPDMTVTAMSNAAAIWVTVTPRATGAAP